MLRPEWSILPLTMGRIDSLKLVNALLVKSILPLTGNHTIIVWGGRNDEAHGGISLTST